MSPNPAALRLEQLTESIAARVVNEVLEAVDVNALLGEWTSKASLIELMSKNSSNESTSKAS